MKNKEEMEDIINDYLLYGSDDISTDRSGVHVIPYAEVFIALESRANHRNRYLGWFCVSPTDKPKYGWLHLTEWKNWHIFQIEKDFMEEPCQLKIYSA